MSIPILRPCVDAAELSAVQKVLESGWLGMGDVTRRFEAGVGGYLGAEHVIAVDHCTSALHLALDALGVGPGDEVIAPSFTFVATIQAITLTGATPVFCDVELGSQNIDVRDAVARFTDKTRAVVPIHYAGYASDLTPLIDAAHARGIAVVDDAAHAFGSFYQGRRIGTHCDATCFSFAATKNLTCGEGGAVITANAELADRMRRRRFLGVHSDTWERRENHRPWEYNVAEQGFRYHMSDINAAIGLAQLDRLSDFAARKRDITRAYNAAFESLDGFVTPPGDVDATFPFMYVGRVCPGAAGKGRDGLVTHLATCGVDASVHYVPNHQQQCFYQEGFTLPATEQLYEEVITLPLFVGLTDEDVAAVIGGVKSYFNEAAVEVLSDGEGEYE